jgi:hypothetical protein
MGSGRAALCDGGAVARQRQYPFLTYLTNGNKGGGIYDKILDILSGWDPRYVLTLVALVLGFLIYASRQKRLLPSEAD